MRLHNKLFIIILCITIGSGLNAIFSKRTRRISEHRPQVSQIKVSPEVAKDEIAFWLPQMTDHALFLYLGLENKKLKTEALKLHKLFKLSEKEFNRNPKVILNKILLLLKQLKDFKLRALKAATSGWVGWLYPSFIKHTIKELEYFEDKLKGKKMNMSDEVKFWKDERADEAIVTAHLLDPSQKALIEKAKNISTNFKRIPKDDIEQLIVLTKKLREFNLDSKKKMSQKELKSIIHPALIDHIMREGQRALEVLNKLQKIR